MVGCLADVEQSIPAAKVLVHPAGARGVAKILDSLPGDLTHNV